ncbi:MAG: tetratricopeptide repeat protein [Deltaproteobacteria bacterium]|nr:tetratricopeptide repeat protein [Candidatus Zymogenaceae bacterium]
MTLFFSHGPAPSGKRISGIVGVAAAGLLAVGLFAAGAPAQEEVDPLLSPGLELIDEGRYDEAALFFEETAEVRLDDPDVFNYLGIARYHLGDFKGALDAFSASLDRDPSYVTVYHNIGVTYHALGLYYLAIENYERALNLIGDDETLFFRLALSYIALQDWETAREYLESAREMNPYETQYQVYLEYVSSKLPADTSE